MSKPPIDFREFCAAAQLAGLPKPVYRDDQTLVWVHWTSNTWEAFVALCEAYEIADMSHAHANIMVNRVGQFPIAFTRFTHVFD